MSETNQQAISYSKFIELINQQTVRSKRNIVITPGDARQILLNNTDNRPIYKSNAKYQDLVSDIKNGKFKLTHQGILFGHNMRLIDGQHRVHGVIEADSPIVVEATFDPDIKTGRSEPIDGGTPRESHWVKGFPGDTWAIATHLCKIGLEKYTIANAMSGFVPANCVEYMAGLVKSLASGMPKTARGGISLTPVKAAVILQIARYPHRQAEIIEQYTRLVSQVCDVEWDSLRELHSFLMHAAVGRSKGRSTSPAVMFAETFRAFDDGITGKRSVSLRSNNIHVRLLQMSEIIRDEFGGPMKTTKI